MAISTVIIDDNPQATEALKGYINAKGSINLVGTATTLAEGRKMIAKHKPTLLFIDIELPDGSGIEFWTELHATSQWFMHAVFYTAFERYAVEALRAHGHDFLVKPLSQEDFDASIDRFLSALADRFLENNDTATNRRESVPSTILVLDKEGRRIAMKHHEICLFSYDSDRSVWEILDCHGNRFVIRHGINAERLIQLSDSFVQVSKNYIVNVGYIASVEKDSIVFFPECKGATSIRVSKRFRNNLYDHFFQL